MNNLGVKVFADNLLGTSSKIKILRTLSETNTAYTIAELENETGLSRGIVHREVTRLSKKGVLFDIKSVGKERAYRINMDNPYSQLISDFFSLEKKMERKNKVILKVWNILESVVAYVMVGKLDIVSVMLFGSHVRGMATPRSDIDILIVAKKDYSFFKDKLSRLFKRYESKLKAKINPVYMSLEIYNNEQRIKTHFINEINKGNIELYGNLTKSLRDSNE